MQATLTKVALCILYAIFYNPSICSILAIANLHTTQVLFQIMVPAIPLNPIPSDPSQAIGQAGCPQ